MKLELLKSSIDNFYQAFQTLDQMRWLWLLDIQKNFWHTWNNNPLSLLEKYKRITSSNESQRIWKKERYRPREVMINLIEFNPEYAQIAFDDLIRREGSISSGMDRFKFYSDELLKQFKRIHTKSNDTQHYQDYAIQSYYLSLAYPQSYVHYNHEFHLAILKQLESLNIPTFQDPERYFKLVHTLYGFLSKHPSFTNSYQGNPESKWIALMYGEWLTSMKVDD